MNRSVALETFRVFSRSFARSLASADRTNLRASLFDVPGRTEVAARFYGENLGWLLRALRKTMSPEALGEQMRKLGGRPNSLHVMSMLWLYLFDREFRLVRGSDSARTVESVEVLDFCGRAMKAYRQDGQIAPTLPRGHMRVLAIGEMHSLYEAARSLSRDEIAALRRLLGNLELYSFMLHGEHRDGIFFHGPYPMSPRNSFLIAEFTDLANSFLPWSTLEVRLPHGSISVGLIISASQPISINLWGSLEEGYSLYDELEGVFVANATNADSLHEIPSEDWNDLSNRARAAQQQLFMQVAGWAPEQRVAYGAYLFANHLVSFIQIADLEADLMPRLANATERAARQRVDVADPTSRLVWKRISKTPPFSPLELTIAS